MLGRFLYRDDGRAHVPHMIATVGACVAMAVFGTLLLTMTPMLGDHEGIQVLWGLFAVVMLKLPLIGLLFWFIVRNKELPTRAPKWDDRETREILDYLLAESERALTLPDSRQRLAYLQREAWNVADRVSGDIKSNAVAVALRIDELQLQRPAGPPGLRPPAR